MTEKTFYLTRDKADDYGIDVSTRAQWRKDGQPFARDWVVWFCAEKFERVTGLTVKPGERVKVKLVRVP